MKNSELPVIYLRPTIDKRVAIWVGSFGDDDPRPNNNADYFLTLKEAEAAIPEIQKKTGKFFGFMYVYLDEQEGAI